MHVSRSDVTSMCDFVRDGILESWSLEEETGDINKLNNFLTQLEVTTMELINKKKTKGGKKC